MSGGYAAGVTSRVLLSRDSVTVGAFRSHPRDRDFADSGPTRGHLLVFPRTCVSIQHAGRAAVVADPSVVMLYNRGQEYVRRAIAPIGDRCEWFAFPAAAILDARGDRDGDADRPFGARTFMPSTAPCYWRAHAALRHAGTDPTLAEELAVSLLDEVLAPQSRHVALARLHLELADAARRWLARRVAEHVTLDTLAAALATSPFHLARVFRRATGRTIHAYRTELRIRAAIERIHDTPHLDLAALAHELGFSSHSHFTAAFKRVVGVPPSQARASKNLTAPSAASPRSSAHVPPRPAAPRVRM